jgi:hypothetical protein
MGNRIFRITLQNKTGLIMTIYPLPPQELDDATLSRQIKNIAQVLCGAHYNLCKIDNCNHHHLDFSIHDLQIQNIFTEWASTCRANYLKLVEMGMDCCFEYLFRKTWSINFEEAQKNKHKLQSVIEWAKLNVPDLPKINTKVLIAEKSKVIPRYEIREFCTHYPLAIPKKYYISSLPGCEKHIQRDRCVIESYRNYYSARLKKRIKCKECAGTGISLTDEFPCNNCNAEGYHQKNLNWTRRKKPEWINDL